MTNDSAKPPIRPTLLHCRPLRPSPSARRSLARLPAASACPQQVPLPKSVRRSCAAETTAPFSP